MATLLMRPAEGGSADKKRRARKGKNAQKKQPQRGLGVAQLEKLRLQEQSLLCNPSPASYSLRLCTTTTPGGADHLSMSTSSRCESSDMSQQQQQTILSLTTNVHAQQAGVACSRAGSALRADSAGVPRLTLNGQSSTLGQNLLSPGVDKSKGNVENFDARHVASRALACLSQSSKFSSANASFYSNMLSTGQLQIFDSQIQHGQAQKLDERRSSGGEITTSGNAPPVFIFPTINNVRDSGSLLGHASDTGLKLHPGVFKDHVQRIPLSLADPQYVESLCGPDVPHLPRKCVDLQVVGVSASIDKSNSAKELSSFQSYPSQQAWPTIDKVSGRKRPWLSLQENAREVGSHAQALDLNAPACHGGENESVHNESSPRGLNQGPDNRVGAHYTTGIVRSALGNSCLPLAKIRACSSGSPWQDSDSPFSASGYFPEMGMCSENGIVFRQCASTQSTVNDNCSPGCSSGTGSSYLTLNRKRCLNDPESVPKSHKLVDKESICSNFLTLGISRSSYPGNGWNEPEESTHDNNPLASINNDVSRLQLKPGSSSTSGRYSEGDDVSHGQFRKSVCQQETVGVDHSMQLEGMNKCFSLEFGGNIKSKPPLLNPTENVTSSSQIHFHKTSHLPTSSLPSISMATASSNCNRTYADHHHVATAHDSPSVKSITTRIVESDCLLDLRLKLAL